MGHDYDDQDRGKWYKNSPEDVSAANEAIKQRDAYEKEGKWYKKLFMADNFGPKVGDTKLDDKVEEAFQDRKKDPNHLSRHKWKYNNNCKDEADKLVQDAKNKK